MNEENKDKMKSQCCCNSDWNDDNFSIYAPLLMLLFAGFGYPADSKVNELEKKVARLEGQVSMLGGVYID